MKKLKPYSPAILRYSVVFIFTVFGMWQILDQSSWISFIPSWVLFGGMTAETFVIINGIFEVFCALALAVGIWIRPVAFLLFLHMISIIIDVGFTMTGMRDVVIAVACFVVFLNGNDALSWKGVNDQRVE